MKNWFSAGKTSLLAFGLVAAAGGGASLAAAPVHAAPVQAANTVPGWPVYANARYGYRVCYPSALLKPAAEAPNGDGRRFVGANRAVLSVWGSNNALDQSVADAAAEDKKRLGAGGQVTYSVVKPNWYVLSGRRNGQIFYLKSVLANGAFSTMELRYPEAGAKAWGPVTARMAKCFSAG